jgi:3-oxoacyl-[acyl-carrier protein] reductase
MDTGLEGKVALVTGAGGGIGGAVALALAREGCHVGLMDVVEGASLEEAADRVRGIGRKEVTVVGDVRRMVDADRAVRATVKELGGLHVLVCCAGITRDAVVWKMGEPAWDDVIDVNLKGCFTMTRHAVPVMREAGWGRIVAIGSINGVRGKFGQTNYAASKAGLVALVKSLAREVGAFGITANVVAPGMVMTRMARTLPQRFVDEAMEDAVLDRLTEPDDVADAVIYLSSERARSVTGETLRVDCGQYM